MIYESEIIEKDKEKDFNSRMTIYLNSKSIHEYIVERDIKGLNKYNFKWTDEFIWWYLFKEKRTTVILYICSAIAFSIGIPIGFWFMGLLWLWSLIMVAVLTACTFVCFGIMNMTVRELANTKVPSEIDRDRNYFKNVDYEMSSQQISK